MPPFLSLADLRGGESQSDPQISHIDADAEQTAPLRICVNLRSLRMLLFSVPDFRSRARRDTDEAPDLSSCRKRGFAVGYSTFGIPLLAPSYENHPIRIPLRNHRRCTSSATGFVPDSPSGPRH